MNLSAQQLITANNLLEAAKTADGLEKELVNANLSTIHPPVPEAIYNYYKSIINILKPEKATLVNELLLNLNK